MDTLHITGKKSCFLSSADSNIYLGTKTVKNKPVENHRFYKSLSNFQHFPTSQRSSCIPHFNTSVNPFKTPFTNFLQPYFSLYLNPFEKNKYCILNQSKLIWHISNKKKHLQHRQ